MGGKKVLCSPAARLRFPKMNNGDKIPSLFALNDVIDWEEKKDKFQQTWSLVDE